MDTRRRRESKKRKKERKKESPMRVSKSSKNDKNLRIGRDRIEYYI